MDSSVSLEDQIWFLRVCHHIPFHSTYFDFQWRRCVVQQNFSWVKEGSGVVCHKIILVAIKCKWYVFRRSKGILPWRSFLSLSRYTRKCDYFFHCRFSCKTTEINSTAYRILRPKLPKSENRSGNNVHKSIYAPNEVRLALRRFLRNWPSLNTMLRTSNVLNV